MGLALPVFLATALIVSVGPHLQAHTMPLPGSSAPTIYESIYPSGVARFASITIWLLQALYPVSVFIGIVAAIWAINAKTVHAFALRMGTAVAVIYTVTDLFGAAVLQIEGASFLSNVIANVAGGVMVAVVGYLLLAVFRALFVALGPSRPTYLIAAISIVAVGMLISATTYVGIVTFYKPLSADVELTATLPLSGAIAPEKPAAPTGAGDDGESNKEASGLMQLGVPAGSFRTRGVDKAGEVAWRAPSDGPKYTLQIYMDTGCFPLTDKPRPASPLVTVDDVSHFILHNGATELIAFSDAKFDVGSDLPSVTQFWLPKPSEGGADSVQYFLSEGDRFSLTGRDNISVSATWFLIENDGYNIRPTSKKVFFEVNGLRYMVSASTAESLGKENSFVCSSVTVGDPRVQEFQAKRAVNLLTDQPMVGLRFKIAEMPQQTRNFSVAPFELRITGINGWSDVQKIDFEPGQYLGKLGFVILNPGSGKFSVYGREIAKDWDRIMLVGDFSVYRPSSDSIRISGIAHSAIRNDVRLNRTRWELLSDGIKVWLIAGFFTVSAALIAWCFRVLKGHLMDDPKTWV